MLFERVRGSYMISTDPDKLDFAVIHSFLAGSYWSPGVPRATVEHAARNSLCFGVYKAQTQVGYARAVTDRATFAYVADVFILEEYRGQGLSKWLMECMLSHPNLQSLRRWMLATADAHGLYERFGFRALQEPERFMEIRAAPSYPSSPDNAHPSAPGQPAE